MAASGKPTPPKAKAGALMKPVADSAVRSERVRAAKKAPRAMDSAVKTANASSVQASEPAGLQPRPSASHASHAPPTPLRPSHAGSSLPSRAASVTRAPGAGPSQPPRLRSRSSQPTTQAPAAMAMMCSSAAMRATVRNCS